MPVPFASLRLDHRPALPCGELALTYADRPLYTCMTMRFEWDAAKSRINQRKHNGLDFETAARVFSDERLVLIEDRIVEGEERWHAIGAVSAALILVVHVYREDEVDGEEIIRIIAAREANQRERRIYLQQAAE